MARDYRYELDGETIEAFQLTDLSQFREDHRPEWMNPSWLMTKNGKQWMDAQGQEVPVPKLWWICRNADGVISVRDPHEMEGWHKVVPDTVVTHPEQPYDEEANIELLAKMQGRDPEEVRAHYEAKKKREAAGQKPVASPVLAAIEEEKQEMEHVVLETDRGLLTEARGVFELLQDGHLDMAKEHLKEALMKRADWCDCAPGTCSRSRETWDCRRSSPLVQ